eukprot:3941231-Rhodomonas_salina.1
MRIIANFTQFKQLEQLCTIAIDYTQHLHPVDRMFAMDELAYRLDPMVGVPLAIVSGNANPTRKTTYCSNLNEYPPGTFAYPLHSQQRKNVLYQPIASYHDIIDEMGLTINLAHLVPTGCSGKIVIAGGFVCRMITAASVEYEPSLLCGYENSDIDFFCVGQWTDAECNQAVMNLVDEIAKHSPRHYTMDPFYCTRRALTIPLRRNLPIARRLEKEFTTTNQNRKIKYQIIFKRYNTIEHLLTSFDIAACAVAYDGNAIYATPRAIKAHQTGVNVVSAFHHSVANGDRLLKYYERGFAICDPMGVFVKNHAKTVMENFMDSANKQRVQSSDWEYDDMSNTITPCAQIVQRWSRDLNYNHFETVEEAATWMINTMTQYSNNNQLSQETTTQAEHLNKMIFDGILIPSVHFCIPSDDFTRILATNIPDPAKK